MNPAIFLDKPMDLLADLLNQRLKDRVKYDASRNILFVNLEAWSVRKKADVADLQKVLVDACKAAGKRVDAVINQDGCRIAEDLYDDYADMVAYVSKTYYGRSARYATSAITRHKLQHALKRRGLDTHVFESADEAYNSLERQAAE